MHRFIRISPCSAGKRHTSFISVQCFPVLDQAPGDKFEIEISPSDLKIESMRAQGAGGQHVNTTESAIRIVHLPTGISACCQMNRSQHQNKAKALEMIKARLYQNELTKR